MEEPLPAGGSCLLGSINLVAYVENGEFKSEDFLNDIHIIVKAMDEVLDQGLPLHPLQVQKDTVRDWRQIGIGIMGLADMLIELGLQYDTDAAIKFCDHLGFIMANEVIRANALLAKKYGPYPKFDCEAVTKSKFLLNNTTPETYYLVERYGLRNSQLLTIAPTGTLSTMLGISGGVEPIFSLSYTRKTEYNGKDVYHKIFTPIAEKYMKKHGLTEEEQLPEFFVTAQNINPFKRVEMQGAWQKHIDASISSTVNLPNGATVEEVEKLYMAAWENGLKGMTIFRDGCDRMGVLTLNNKKEEKVEEEVKSNEIPRGVVVPTSDDVIGLKRKLTGGCGSLHLQVYFDRTTGKMTEVFVNKGGGGGCNSNLNALSRMISIALRAGVDVKDIADQLSSTINCPSFASSKAKGIKLSPGSSCASAVGKALINLNKEFQLMFNAMRQLNEEDDEESTDIIGLKECPECKKKTLQMSGGCMQCNNCGYSKCD